jgi:hypothetical protein
MPIAGDIQSLVEEIKSEHRDRTNYLKSNRNQVKVLMADIRGFMGQVKVDRETRRKIIIAMLKASKGERRESFRALFDQMGKEKKVRKGWIKGLVAVTRDYQKDVRNDLLTARKAWASLSATEEPQSFDGAQQKNGETPVPEQSPVRSTAEEQKNRETEEQRNGETDTEVVNKGDDNKIKNIKPKKELSEKQKEQYKRFSEQIKNRKRNEEGKFIKTDG